MFKKQYKETILANGLRVISNELDSPISTIDIWIKAGSRYEDKDQLGYAHILEHMLLKGTKTRPTSFDFRVAMDRVGAISNAMTYSEFSRFFVQVASDYQDLMFELLADALLNALVDPTVLENEKKVIIE